MALSRITSTHLASYLRQERKGKYCDSYPDYNTLSWTLTRCGLGGRHCAGCVISSERRYAVSLVILPESQTGNLRHRERRARDAGEKPQIPALWVPCISLLILHQRGSTGWWHPLHRSRYAGAGFCKSGAVQECSPVSSACSTPSSVCDVSL